MTLKLYNTLTRKKEGFKPIEKKQVKLYTCGPTVYNYAHIGNLRAYVFEDILRRVLEYNGYKVNHVMNITDVGHLTDDADSGEDKIEKGAQREGKSALEIAAFYTKAFQQDMKDLNLLEPTTWCKASQHIKEQIALVQTLIDKGFTYETSDGIYFDTTKIDDYGKLAQLNKQKLQAGARVELGEKKNPHDFALWKFSKPEEKRQQEWPAFGRMGFPGWHIECSAMSMKYLGQHFDIHCGGVDHIAVHHSNEIAQSEAATGKKPWVNYWLHGEFLLILKNTKWTCPHCNKENTLHLMEKDLETLPKKWKLSISCFHCKKIHQIIIDTKMAKSTGNFITLQTIKDKYISPLAYRYFLLQTHYRKQLNFSWEALEAAETGLERLQNKVLALKIADEKIDRDKVEINRDKFLTLINDDLNIPEALALVWESLKEKTIDYETLLDFDRVLGLGLADIKEEKTKIPAEVQELLDKRTKAREDKNWDESDKLRDKIAKLGFKVEDGDEGQRVMKL